MKKEITRKRIKHSFIELLEEKEPLRITVSELCEKCNINRSTFYEYYSYIDLLIKDIISDQIKEIHLLNANLYDRYYEDRYTGPENTAKFLTNLASNAVLMKLLKSSQSGFFKSLIVDLTVEYEIKKYNVTDKSERIKIIYRNSGVYAIAFMWIDNRMKLSLNETAESLYKLITEQK